MEIKEPGPAPPHPAYPADKLYANEPKRTWRCQECHGWDYLGKDGAYGTGPHYTGIKGIQGMAGADAEAIIAVLELASCPLHPSSAWMQSERCP